MKKLFLSGSFIAISSVALAESAISANYVSVDGTVKSGNVSFYAGGGGLSLDGTLDVGDTGFVATAGFDSLSGTISGVDWSSNSMSLGVGYKIIDQMDDNSGIQLMTSVGYISSEGDITSGGTKYTLDSDATVLTGQAEGKIANWLSVNGGVVLDLEGDSNSTVSVGVAYDITETGSIDLGYSEIKSTSSTAVTSRLSGWSIGYKMSF